jgi:hypothetical protein
MQPCQISVCCSQIFDTPWLDSVTQAHAMAVLVSNFASAVEMSAAPPAVSRLCILFAVEGVIQHSGEQ